MWSVPRQRHLVIQSLTPPHPNRHQRSNLFKVSWWLSVALDGVFLRQNASADDAIPKEFAYHSSAFHLCIFIALFRTSYMNGKYCASFITNHIPPRYLIYCLSHSLTLTSHPKKKYFDISFTTQLLFFRIEENNEMVIAFFVISETIIFSFLSI